MKAKRKTPRYRPVLMVTMAVMWAVAIALPGAELGRLFTTPQERAALDKLRRAGPTPVAAPEQLAPPEQPEQTLKAQPQPITVNGLVRRSDGANTVWVNGVNSLEGEFDSQGFQVDTHLIRGNRVTVTVSGQPVQQIEMKPGQTFDPAAGRVVDVYGGKETTGAKTP